MVRGTPTWVCNPPTLPEYLKNIHDLKPILGVPTDDEVKAVHAVIRAAQTVSQGISWYVRPRSIYEPFPTSVRGANGYRDRYPCSMFPEDIVHTPPALPSHLPISLKPINGVPSDEELKSVHAAVRAYEQFSISTSDPTVLLNALNSRCVVPSMFDPNVGVELSQHVFNVQFSRYMDHAPRGKLGSKAAPQSSAPARQPVDLLADASDEEDPVISKEAKTGDLIEPPPSVADVQPPGSDNIAPTITERDPGWIPKNLIDTMEVVKALVSCQRMHARFIRQSCRGQGGSSSYIKRYEVMNEKGQLPTSRGLPLVEPDRPSLFSNNVAISNSELAQYLRFYEIGSDLVEEGGTSIIKEGCRGVAINLLRTQL